MNSLIKTTIKRPVTICVLVVILLAVGILAAMDMSTNLLPNIKMPMMGITVIYPGAGAQSVEDSVTAPMENALQTIPGITELETKSYDNVSIAILTFDYGTDIDKKIDAIEDTFKTVTFPQGCQEPSFVKIDMNGTAAATVSIYQDVDSPDANLLAREAQALATKFRAIEGVGSVKVMGAPEKQVKITALQGLDITALALVQALSKENLDLPLGTIMQDGSVVSIRNASDATSVLQIMQLPVTMELGASVLSSLASLQTAVKTYATCTLNEFEDYVKKMTDAKSVIDEIDGKSYEELNDLQNNLSAIKSLMAMVRENSGADLDLMWERTIKPLVNSEQFQNMDEVQLRQWANQRHIDYEIAKYVQDGAKDGTLETDWKTMVEFRKAMEDSHDENFTGADISYDQFATLFQDGDTVDVFVRADGVVTGTEKRTYVGLDMLHSQDKHDKECNKTPETACDRETFDAAEAANVCEFADSVNTVAFQNIIDTVKEAEDKGETAEISDEQFAALFINSTQGNDFAALLSPQVIHIIRLENFNQDVTDVGGNVVKESIVGVLREYKIARVEAANPDDPTADRNAVYLDGKPVVRNDDKQPIVIIGEGDKAVEYRINNFGRVINGDKRLVDGSGNVLTLSDDEIMANYYSYGGYIVFTDEELLELYDRLDLGDFDLGITPTLDTIGFIRKTEIDADAAKIIVPAAYVGAIEQITTYQAYSQYNGRLAVTLEVYAVADANTTKVVTAVKKAISEAVTESDVTSAVTLLDDKAEFINDSISNVLSSILIGGVLAILVIYLFVGKIRSSLVVSITMPLSVLVALLGLWAMNISLNLVSLGGLAVGIGMLVDNSIVVLESITKRRDAGESVYDSCLNGTREVAGSLLASTLTNICVFFPILFAKGLTREIFYDLVWAVMFSIVMSLIVAVTVIPSLYHLVYHKGPRPRYRKNKNGDKEIVGTFEDGEPRGERKPLYDENAPVVSNIATDAVPDVTDQAVTVNCEAKEGKPQKERKKKQRKPRSADKAERKRGVLTRMENGYGTVLSKVLTKRVWVCVVALVLFAGSVGLVFTTGVDFLPSVDKGILEINLRFDGSATLDEVNEATKQAVSAVRSEYGDKILYTSYTVGKQGMLPMNITGVARVHIDTKRLKTSQTVNDVRKLLANSGIKAKNIAVSEIDGVVAELTGEMAGQAVTLMSDNMDDLVKAASEVETKLWTIKGVQNVTNNTPQETKQYSFVFDKDECAHRGVDYQNAVLLLRVGMSGFDAANITVDGDKQAVNVGFKDETKDNLQALLDVIVGFDNDGAVKISDVLKKNENGQLYETDSVVTVVNRKDGKFVTTVDVESYGVDMGTVTKAMKNVSMEVLASYPSVSYEEGGVSYYLTDAMNGLVISLIAAFLLLYGVMACQFESLVKPFVVIMSIPFSFTGGFLALVITGTTLNVVSFVGIIMLMGVIVNGAIVMIDKIELLIKEGVPAQQAVIQGCKSRLRPILMTTLTTILALMPLAIGIGRGSELMQPMGIVVVGGLLLGTLVTLVLIPCFYCIVKRIKFTSIVKASADGSDTVSDAEAIAANKAAESADVQAEQATESQAEKDGAAAASDKNVDE